LSGRHRDSAPLVDKITASLDAANSAQVRVSC
jgi:hypothetical protein